MKKALFFLLLVLGTAYCSLLRKDVVPYPTGITFPLEKAAEVTYSGEIIGPLRPEEERVYFSTQKGEVFCVDGQKHEISWTFRAPEPLDSPVYLFEKRLYVSSLKGILYCLNKEGQSLWEKDVGEKVSSGVEEAHGRAYFGTESGACYGIDPERGEEIWKFSTGDAVRPTPLAWKDLILFNCEDGNIHFLDKRGNPAGSYAPDSPVQSPLAVADGFLYFATKDEMLLCVDIEKHREKWRIRSGSPVHTPPVVHSDKVFFLGWNGVLYCLKKNGTILWWSIASSRSSFPPEIVEDRIVVASLSPEIVCFDIATGESRGVYVASGEIHSNPVWLSPSLLVSLYDHSKDQGTLVFLKKKIAVELSSSKKPPQRQAEEITFSAKAVGFHLPEYEFSLTRFVRWDLYLDLFVLIPVGEREVVQEQAQENQWKWIPGEEGIFLVRVAVTDAKSHAKTETLFEISEEEKQMDNKKTDKEN